MSFLEQHHQKVIWTLCILSFFAALGYNEVNFKHLPNKKKRAMETVKTMDGSRYLYPATNFKEEGIWKDTFEGKQSYFLRAPGYGLFYLGLLYLADFPQTLHLLKMAQLLLFAVSVYWFYHISSALLKNRSLAFITTCIYGLSPFHIGFLYYTLTEGITPQLLLAYVFTLVRAFYHEKSSSKIVYYTLASAILSFIFITRPVLTIFGLLLPLFIVADYGYHNLKQLSKKLFLYGAIACSLMLIWQIRNYKVAHEVVGLYPIYHNETNNMFRPTLLALWNFNKSWGVEGHVYHSYSKPLFDAAIQGDTSIAHINRVLDATPSWVIEFYGKERLVAVYRQYQSATLHQKTYFDQGLLMPKTIPSIEQETIAAFKQLTREFKSAFWWQYHVISPLKVFRVMAFHSNLSLYMFQHTFRGNPLMEFMRLLFFSLHGLCFLSILVGLFRLRSTNVPFIGLTISCALFFLFLCYYQRGIEERYTLPLLPFLLIMLMDNIRYLYTIFKKRYESRITEKA